MKMREIYMILLIFKAINGQTTQSISTSHSHQSESTSEVLI